MNKMIGMAVAIALSAGSAIAFAQTPAPKTPATPPATTQPAPSTTPATPAPSAPGAMTPSPATPAAPATPATPVTTATSPSSPAETAGSCRTRKAEGEACACLKDPTVVGMARVAPDGGKNMCVMG